MTELGHVLWLGFLGVALAVQVMVLLAFVLILAGRFFEWWGKR